MVNYDNTIENLNENTKNKNFTDVTEKMPIYENDEMSPDPELLKKVVDDGIKELFSD